MRVLSGLGRPLAAAAAAHAPPSPATSDWTRVSSMVYRTTRRRACSRSTWSPVPSISAQAPPSLYNPPSSNPLRAISHPRLHAALASSTLGRVRSCFTSANTPFAASAIMSSASKDTVPRDAYRLPTDVRPTHYDLTVRTDLDKELFEGIVRVDLDILRTTRTITLNAATNLTLAPASLSTSETLTLAPTASTYDAPTERATFAFAQDLPAGSKATLSVGFSAPLDGSMTGYYASKWDKGVYALTQFEPTSARGALPCWDEPALKATFAVTLVSRAGTVSLSNMPVLPDSPATDTKALADDEKALYAGVAEGDWVVSKYATTPPMSTYLLAYANGPFEYLESSYKSPLSGAVRPLRIYATPDCIHQAQFALDVKAKVLPLYEQVFDVEYPLPKLDTLVASDFDAGAMENWGLITGRTSAFLLDPERADMLAKKRVAVTQSHEVAHMWFGNITTMEWWNYLYLNEGFATVMGEVIIMDKVFPEWKVDSEFITEHLNDALRLDAKLSSHPIEVDCPDANQINQIFDSLSYAKAGSVLRMLSKYVGEEKFLKGVSIYLKKHLYANSVTTDLWEGIGEATGIDVPKVMDNWVTKMGFPVLTVTETEGGITVRQDRFLEDGPAKPEDNETIWTIPLSLLTTTSAGQAIVDKGAVLDVREKAFAVDTSKPFKLNADTSGVYRVLYTPERLAAIAQEAARADSVFSLNDRIGLVHDAMALAKAGFLDVSAALTLVHILREEREFLVWDSISENLSRVVDTWWENDAVVEKLNAFRRELYGPIVARLGFEYSAKDDADTSQLRTRAIGQAAAAQDPKVVKALQDRFAQFVKTGDDAVIPADLLRVTFRTAVKYGGREEYDAVVKFHDEAKTPSMRIAAMYAMGATQDAALQDATMRFVMDRARDQDVTYFFSGLAANFKARRPLVAFFEDNYDALYKRFEGNFTLKYLVTSVLSGLSTEADRQSVDAFFKDKDTGKYNLALAQALDGINAKSAWIARSSADIQQWLDKWEQGAKL
ncbi:Metallo peptidase M1 [Heterobasidion irregulare TC 32-1]|uniref:Metallo peptidase M1 n=1 Tax=Heterobasidion irregulare (strain TC 32-1) TaxID=747525 RepID=W4KCD0_HETIT|nr:Metallo peptidase M1 [Heterobasidion irregulare TC 32-1]ETW82731.1 Metallo peptidase M1 [Heterobasidion irregulare TC 32-1]